MVRLDSSSAELRQSHRAKGFDPDSQDLACHLGYPIYQLHNRAEPVDPLSARDSQDGDQDPVNINADGEKHVHESTTAGEEPGPAPSLRDEMPVSQTFRFFMNVQGMLFLFLPSSWLYDQL
ncbi:hypothetical protein B0H13DRAFT_1860701 [Mycena leptocephala]|nr:hypothetical protein B0H13DRAFT_1860701 [Mycena leptocephala]